MKPFVLKILFLNGLFFCLQSVYGQSSNKLKITERDFEKWSAISYHNLSPNGHWVTYKLVYDSGFDTLFVKDAYSKMQYSFSNGNSPSFSDNNQWLTVKNTENILLINLKSGSSKTIDSAIKADFIMQSKYLVLLLKSSQHNDLLIVNLLNNHEVKLKGIKEYVISVDKSSIGYITEDNKVQVFWVDKVHKNKVIIDVSSNPRKNLVWNNDGNSLAFLEEINNNETLGVNNSIYFFRNVKKKEVKYYLNPEEYKNTFEGKAILAQPPFTPLLISPDNKRILFYTKGQVSNSSPKNGVEIWNSNDKIEYKRNLLEGNSENRPKLFAWLPHTMKIIEITNNEHHSVYLTPDKNKAIVFDPHQYEPQNEIMGPSDLWLKDINTGENKMMIEKQSGKVERLGISPNSKYLNYYKDKNWWVQDLDTGAMVKLTDGLNVEDSSAQRGHQHPSYGFVGWTIDSKYVLINTAYDIWLISIDGKERKRITNGQKDKTRYRVCANLTANVKLIKMYDFVMDNFDLKKGLIIEAFDMNSKASGYFKWDIKNKLTSLAFNKSKLSNIRKSTNANAFIMVEQQSDSSPQIIHVNTLNEQNLIVKTNKHQDKFEWTKSELISYINSDGKPLDAVLFYPAGYKPDKKYPMIVYIYEEQSHKLHNYYNPSYFNHIGFNPANYFIDDYFVLLPDIIYKQGEVGYSAFDCVESAVKKTLKYDFIDKNRIGLIGHSFGGYETNFIITQTNRFAAAVSGAGFSDFISHSLSTEKSGRSQMWRYQTHQMRMGNALYDDYSGFMSNSPITHAYKINTPLLSWTGMNDYQVDPQQSIEFHMAMRSLKKKNIFLLYPNEGHVLFNPDFQKDLTIKTKAWFDFYLKDKTLPSDLK